jgi:hypothetical protein
MLKRGGCLDGEGFEGVCTASYCCGTIQRGSQGAKELYTEAQGKCDHGRFMCCCKPNDSGGWRLRWREWLVSPAVASRRRSPQILARHPSRLLPNLHNFSTLRYQPRIHYSCRNHFSQVALLRPTIHDPINRPPPLANSSSGQRIAST